MGSRLLLNQRSVVLSKPGLKFTLLSLCLNAAQGLIVFGTAGYSVPKAQSHVACVQAKER